VTGADLDGRRILLVEDSPVVGPFTAVFSPTSDAKS
jgi:hypothetical protein